MSNLQHLIVPRHSLAADAPAVRSLDGGTQVCAVVIPDVPLEILGLALEAAMGRHSSPEWPTICGHLSDDLMPDQCRDLARWAISLMPDFGLPSPEHRGLFADHNVLALNVRMDVCHPTPWAYEVVRWEAHECSCACIVAIQRDYLSAQARVSEIYKVAYYEDDDGIEAYLNKIRSMKQLLAVTISMRRNLAPNEPIALP